LYLLISSIKNNLTNLFMKTYLRKYSAKNTFIIFFSLALYTLHATWLGAL